MIEFENYKSNLVVDDKYDVKNVKVSNGVVFTGSTDRIFEKQRHIDRTSSSLAAAVIGLDNTSIPIPKKSKFLNIWTDHDAQEIFVNTKPTCYLILGKAGVGSYFLGEALSKKLNCIHLCPRHIILDELEQKTSTGRTLDFNMKENIKCSFDVIMKILKVKIESAVVQHRGYIISDLPLVTCSKDQLYYFESKFGEEGFLVVEKLLFDLICNLKKKKHRKSSTSQNASESSQLSIPGEDEEGEEEEEERTEDQPDEEAVEEEEDAPAVLPKFLLNGCSGLIKHKKGRYDTKQGALLRQLEEVFSLSLAPDVIIHLSCPDANIVTIRNHKYLNYITGVDVQEPFESNYVYDLRRPSKAQIKDYECPHDPHVFNPKYNCRQPMHFPNICVDQTCNYKQLVDPFMQKKIRDFNPKMVIQLDGRSKNHVMLHNALERLVLMHIQPVLIPVPLHLKEPPEDMEEFWTTVSEFKSVRSGVVHFKRSPSLWYNRCPVELKLRRSLAGNPKYSIALFNHVYVMSSLKNFISFYENPRPYLQLKYLEPTCRVIIIGTQSSGKSMIAECLSWLFDCPITSFKDFLEKEKEKKYDIFARSILSEIIATIEDARYRDWQQTESDRVAKLNAWSKYVLRLLKEYCLLVKSSELQTEADIVNVEEQIEEQLDEKLEKQQEQEDSIVEKALVLDPNKQLKINNLKKKLSFLPILNNLEACETAILNNNFSEYAPAELTTVPNKPAIPALGDEDVTIAISNYILTNDLKSELLPTSDEIMSEMVKHIYTIDANHEQETKGDELYGKYIIDGLPSDPEYWDHLSNSKLMPDHTIALIENKEVDQELMQHYINVEKCTKYYTDKVLAANDPLIETKLVGEKSQSIRYIDIKSLTNYLIDRTLDAIFLSKNQEVPETVVASFSDSIDKFREDWDSLKLKLEEKSKSYIEVELQEKNDVQIIEEVLLKLRESYTYMPPPSEDADVEIDDEKKAHTNDLLTYNDPKFYCETNIYCPITYYEREILWEGKPEFSLLYQNKVHNFASQEFLEMFRKNKTRYQGYNKPFKVFPKVKVCITGSIGCGATVLSKQIAKELGLLYINFADIINDYMKPKHFKKVGRKYENVFTDPLEVGSVVDFQMGEEDENLISDILTNEHEMRQMILNYFDRGTPLLSGLTKKMVNKIWFDPFVPTGFVLDGYPRIPSDFEDMLSIFCIPDIVIDLESNSEIAVKRMAPGMFNQWKNQQLEAKSIAQMKLNKEREEWTKAITQKIVVKLIIEEIFENMFFSPGENAKRLSVESAIIDSHPSGSSNVDPHLFNAYNEMIQEYPEPIDTNVWEKYDEARERIETRIEGLFECDNENIQAMKELMSDNKIKMVTIDGTKPADRVLRLCLSSLMDIKNRCESLFEQTFIVTPEMAEILIQNGFYFISKFNRICPVHIYKYPNSVQNTYKIAISKGTLFPVVHRSYIYYISNKEFVTKFRTNPLKYVTGTSIQTYCEYPLRVAVIGTPKSGQSTLAAKLAKDHCLLCISKGSAVRSVLENMPWTKLANKLREKLEEGKILDDDLIVRAIQTLVIDHRTVTYGYIYDGFPATPYQAKGLVKNGLYPNIIIDLDASKEKIMKNALNEVYYDVLKYRPTFPKPLVEKRFENWRQRRIRIRSWIAGDYQNLCLMNANQSKWKVLQDVSDRLSELALKIHFYLSNVDKTIVRAMWISNESFAERQSSYKNLCPVCFSKKIYKHSDFPPDKKGVVQYKNFFYWICEEHMDTVMMFPHVYLVPQEIEIPEIAVRVSTINKEYLHERGICIVTYAEHLPAQKVVMGSLDYACRYSKKAYLFCSSVCLAKFMAKPQIYYDIKVFRESRTFQKLSLKKLPHLGYLEQTLGNILTDACCSVNIFRPKYPGLTFQLSALIYIALYLKTNNPMIDANKKALYRKAFNVFEARCKMLTNAGLLLRSMNNPFVSHPKCHHPKPTLRPTEEEEELCSATIQRPSQLHRMSNYVQKHKSSVFQSSHRRSTVTARRVPVPDERFDYLCEFHKPASKVPAFLNVVDIAGLVRGAAEGQGLGNAFLSHIKACDAILNLCRAFDDEDVIHVDGDVNPVRDLETIGEELRLKDEELLMQSFEKLDRVVNRGGDKKLKPEYDALNKIKTILVEEKKHIRFGDWTAADIEVLNKYLFLTSKPALYLVNLSEKDYIRKKNKWLPKLKEWIDKNDPGAPLIPFSGVLETKLIEMEAPERQAFLKEHNITSALDKIIVQGYKALNLEYFFTAGPDEVKAWTIQKGTKAPQAAGRIHTDFEKGFIMAEVMHFKDFKEEGTEAACKAAGKYRQQGRNYVVEDGDIIFFKFNAGAGLKDAKKK